MSDEADNEFNPVEIKSEIAQHILTNEQKNEIIKKAWIERMQESKPLPEDLLDKYQQWVKDMIMEVQQAIQQAKQQQMPEKPKGGSK